MSFIAFARVAAGIAGVCADAVTGPRRRAAMNAGRRVEGSIGSESIDDGGESHSWEPETSVVGGEVEVIRVE
jgi:hypothetical protein